jgi:hypothetical protein
MTRVAVRLDSSYLGARWPLYATRSAERKRGFSSGWALALRISNSQTPILAQRRASYIKSNITRPGDGLTPTRRGAS